MRYTFICCLASVIFLDSCKKDDNAIAIAPEIFPSHYVATHWHNNTPYVRMFTKNGEVRNENIIHEYLQRRELTYNFSYQETEPMQFTSTEIFLDSKDSIFIRSDFNQLLDLSSQYKLDVNGNSLYFKSNTIRQKFVDSYLIGILRFRNEMSVYKWGYEIYPNMPNDFDSYTYKPEIYTYKIDSNILSIPYLRFQKWDFGISSEIFANKLNVSVQQSLSATDTLLVQEIELIFKRQW